jgi:hypothetical protein
MEVYVEPKTFTKRSLKQRIEEACCQEKPEGEEIEEVRSENNNGLYKLYRLSDGSYFCNCLSFLFQRGIQTFDRNEQEVGFVTCKHIRMLNIDTNASDARKASLFQLQTLKRFGVGDDHFDALTYCQAYQIIQFLLENQNISWKRWCSLMRKHEHVSLLPSKTFGVELEHFIPSEISTHQYAQTLTDKGIPTEDNFARYNHITRDYWKVMYDATVSRASVSGYIGIELVSPKLYSATGLEHLRNALDHMQEMGASTKNRKICGTHVHIDAYGWEKVDWIRLAKVWMKIEKPIIHFLVAKSRRSNNMCKMLTEQFIEQVQRLWDEEQLSRADRYYSINPQAFAKHQTIEFRIMNGVLNFETLAPWIIFLLKLTEAVKDGLDSDMLTAPDDFEALLDLIGMSENAVDPIVAARAHLVLRFQKFRSEVEDSCGFAQEEEQEQEEEVEQNRIEAIVDREQLRSEYNELLSNTQTRRCTPEQRIAPNSTTAEHLCSYHTYRQRRIDIDSVAYQGDGRTWIVSASRGRGFSIVTSSAFDISRPLQCNCRTFRSYGHCNHSEAVARYMVASYRQNAGGE